MSALSFISQTAQYYNDYNSYVDPSSSSSTELPAGVAVAMVLMMLVFIVVIYALHAYFLGRIFKKAGVESWKAWVPVYNSWVMLELGGQPGFWAVLAIIPLVNIASAVFMYIAMYHIGLKLGKEGAFVLLAIFLPIVWMIWLAMDSSTWQGQTAPVQAPAAPNQPAAPVEEPSNPTPPAQPQQ